MEKGTGRAREKVKAMRMVKATGNRTVESVRENTRHPFEIVVIDDGSTDGSCDKLNGANLKIVRHEERIGVAPSRNDGGAIATGEVVAFLDVHQRLSDGCLFHGIRRLERHLPTGCQSPFNTPTS